MTSRYLHSLLALLAGSLVVPIACFNADPLSTDGLTSPDHQSLIVPSGSVLSYDCTLPEGVELTGGYFDPSGTLIAPVTVATGATLSLTKGTILLGDLIVPADTTICPSFVLPGGRYADNAPDNTQPGFGLLIPPGLDLPDVVARYVWIPGGSIVTGSQQITRADQVFPANTIFTNGYEMPSAGNSAGDATDARNPDRGDILAANSTPNSFPMRVNTPETIPSGSLFLGAGIVDGAAIMALPVNLTGATLVPRNSTIPTPGLSIPSGSYLPFGAVIPAGAVIQGQSDFPTGTVFTQGYVDNLGVYMNPTTLVAPLTLIRGSILVGDTILPAIDLTSVPTGLAGPIYLPAGTRLDATNATPALALPGMVQAEGTTNDQGENLSPGTVVFGTISVSGDPVTFPAGTHFWGGYNLGGVMTQPSISTAAVTLNLGSGDELFGGAVPSTRMSIHQMGSPIVTLATGYRIDASQVIPTPGLPGIANTAFPSGAMVRSGSPILRASTFPAGAIQNDGIIDASGIYSYNPVAPALGTGDTLTGEVYLPAGTALTTDLYMPSGTKLSAPTNNPPVPLGAVIPRNYTLDLTNPNFIGRLSDGAILAGSDTDLTASVDLPVGTDMLGGYRIAGAFVQPGILTSAITLAAGDRLYGGALIPIASEPIMPDQFTGAVIVPAASRIPNPGMELPIGSYLLQKAKWAPGAATMIDITIPTGANFVTGYVLNDATKTFGFGLTTAPLLFPAGSAAVDQVMLPTINSITAALFLSGETVFGDSAFEVTRPVGTIIPPASTLPSQAPPSAYAEIMLPSWTRILGYSTPLPSALTLPPGAVFRAGYVDSTGTRFTATQATALAVTGMTLGIGDLLLGQVELPLAPMTLMTNNTPASVVIAGAIVIEQGAVQPVKNLIMPVGTRSLSGITSPDANLDGVVDINPVEPLTVAPVLTGMLNGQTYCRGIAVNGRPVAYTGQTSVDIAFETNRQYLGIVEYTTDGAFATGIATAPISSSTLVGISNTFTNKLNITGLTAATKYFYRFYYDYACPSRYSATYAFITTDACAGNFQLVNISPTYLATNPASPALPFSVYGWNGTFGDGGYYARTLEDIRFNPLNGDNKLYFASQNYSTGLPEMFVGMAPTAGPPNDMTRIIRSPVNPGGFSGGNTARQLTAVGFQRWPAAAIQYLVYMGFANSVATDGFLANAAQLSFSAFNPNFFTDPPNYTITALDPPANNNSDGLGSDTDRYITRLLGSVTGVDNNFMYMAVHSVGGAGVLRYADTFSDAACTVASPHNSGAAIANDFTNNTGSGGGFLFQRGTAIDSVEVNGTQVYAGVRAATGAELHFSNNAKGTAALHAFVAIPIAGLNANASVEELKTGGTPSGLFLGTENPLGAQAYSCTAACTAAGSWTKILDFATGAGTSTATPAPNNTAIEWMRYMTVPTTWYLGTMNSVSGAEIWRSTDNGVTWSNVSSGGCAGTGGGFGDPTYVVSPVAEVVTMSGTSILYVAFQQTPLYQNAITGDVRVYRKFN